jgi:FkbM family methyltransferase
MTGLTPVRYVVYAIGVSEHIFTLKDGTRVVLPDDLRTMTSYIVEEQRDWFEAELDFVRELVCEGEKVVDVGANFGLYTLAMAKRTGPNGRVLAFEPAASTAGFLRKSVAENGYGWVQLEQVALAAEPGRLELAIGASPELNQLIQHGGSSEKTELVDVRTLAEFTDQLAGVSFIKLDAEGAEIAILDGSGELLQREDPALMLELVHGRTINHGLVAALESRGLAIYVYVRGLRALRPAHLDAPADAAALNVFAMKSSRAQKLAARRLLAKDLPEKVDLDRRFASEAWARSPVRAVVKGKDVSAPMAWHAMAIGHEELPVRARSLEIALDAARRDAEQRPTLPRLLTAARVAYDAGDRATQATMLGRLLEQVDPAAETIEAPFLNVLPRYDAITPTSSVGELICAQVLEGYVRATAYSTYFAGAKHLPFLESFDTYPYPEPEMRRRLEMARRLFAPRTTG